MVRIDIIAAIPELLQSPFEHSIIQRAKQKSLLEINVIPIREYGLGKHQQIDDYQYGGGAGMVMMVEPLDNCLQHLTSQSKADEIIFLTPDGETLNQRMANKLSCTNHMILICGHYKGVDQRIRDNWVTQEISIGDYVLSGGETAAIVLVDAIGRLIPGVLNDGSSALTDSFQNDRLAPPVYTRPATYNGWKVPDVLLSGNDAKIENWRESKADEITQDKRPDLMT